MRFDGGVVGARGALQRTSEGVTGNYALNPYPLIAAVDLGSNSFRLQVAQVENGQFYARDAQKDTVRIAAGLGENKLLDRESQERALACLARFGERLRGFPGGAVRAVATNTFRAAKNARAFLAKAESRLGHPIEIIAGHEEARLIYLGVAHGLPRGPVRRLVVDIGGGSTELIVGAGLEPHKLESLYMGCVSYSRRYFPEGKISRDAMEQAELAARLELQSIVASFNPDQWDEAIGSSGTARALAAILEQNGWSETGITPQGLDKLREKMIKAGDLRKLDLDGLAEDRAPVLAGGLVIMAAIFSDLKLEQMSVSDKGLRDGVLHDMVGRIEHHDVREQTVGQFMQRYHVDTAQAARVEKLALALLRSLLPGDESSFHHHFLAWAARLHEIGLTISYNRYHKHSAYIIEYADMPGFSTTDQDYLSLLALAHRGSIEKVQDRVEDRRDWLTILALRLAVLFHRARVDAELPRMRVASSGSRFSLALSAGWLQKNPLCRTFLEQEAREWKAAGFGLAIDSGG